MVSKSVAFLLADLGVTKTHSRPHVSNDNPFSEAQFKTLKYRPAFPDRFGSIQDARAHGQSFFTWYNTEHHHSGLGLLTPADVHHGLAEQRVAARATVLATAYATHPERFPAGLPHPPARPVEVWINPPKTRATEETRGLAATGGGVLAHAGPGQLLSAHCSDLHRQACLGGSA
jgi:putative transposase